jgi:hypothetical protein
MQTRGSRAGAGKFACIRSSRLHKSLQYIPSDTFRGVNWQSPPTIEHTQNSTQGTGTDEEDFCAARSAAFLLYCIAFLYKQMDPTHDALARRELTALSAVECHPTFTVPRNASGGAVSSTAPIQSTR